MACIKTGGSTGVAHAHAHTHTHTHTNLLASLLHGTFVMMHEGQILQGKCGVIYS